MNTERLTDAESKIIRYIRHYPEWVSTIETMTTARAITYDSDKVQTSPQDVMLQMTIRIEEYQERIDKVDRVLEEIYVTDSVINEMRGWFCYQKGRTMKDKQFYALRKAFAGRLVEVFGEKR